jgi:hypothetical protein
MQDSGVTVTQGRQITLSSKGVFDTDVNAPGILYGPDGETWTPVCNPRCLAPNLTTYALLCRVGQGPIFVAGKYITFSAAEAGNLYFGINDAGFSDNFSDIVTTISVQ